MSDSVNKFSGLRVNDVIVFDYPDSKTGEPKLRRGTVVASGIGAKSKDGYVKIESKTIQLVDDRPASTFSQSKVIGEVKIVSFGQ